MKTYVLVYEGFAHFEVILASYFLKTRGEMITVGLKKELVTSGEGYQIMPHITLDEMDLDDVDVFIIPGGEPTQLYEETLLYDTIKELNDRDVVLGAICAGPTHLAKAGVLEGKEYTTSWDLSKLDAFDPDMFVKTNVVIDDNIITAQPTGYVDFGLALGEMMDIYEDDDDYEETVNFFKYFTFEG